MKLTPRGDNIMTGEQLDNMRMIIYWQAGRGGEQAGKEEFRINVRTLTNRRIEIGNYDSLREVFLRKIHSNRVQVLGKVQLPREFPSKWDRVSEFDGKKLF